MSGYIILCPADTDWAMSPEVFTSKLKERWFATEIEPSERPRVAFYWHIKDDNVDLQGHFSRDGLTVGCDRFEGYAIFACWYRSLVPSEVPLILMDDDYNVVYPLTPGITPDDILSGRTALSPPPDPQVLFTRIRKTST